MSSEHAELARRAYAAFNRGDVEGALVHLDPGIEWHTSPHLDRGARVFRGHEGVRELLALLSEALDEFQSEPERYIDAGAVVVVPLRITGRVPASGQEVSYDLVHVWTVRDRRAIRLDVYDSLPEACAAAGIEPPAASSA
jgi:ketosteroid isomerase-like protein